MATKTPAPGHNNKNSLGFGPTTARPPTPTAEGSQDKHSHPTPATQQLSHNNRPHPARRPAPPSRLSDIKTRTPRPGPGPDRRQPHRQYEPCGDGSPQSIVTLADGTALIQTLTPPTTETTRPRGSAASVQRGNICRASGQVKVEAEIDMVVCVSGGMGFHDGIVSQGFQNTMRRASIAAWEKKEKGTGKLKIKGIDWTVEEGFGGGALAGGMPIADGCVLGCG